jgi:tetratricopeptide (TPR) repeat protein
VLGGLRHKALAFFGCMVLLLAAAACGDTQPPTPTPSPADEHIARGKDHDRKGDYRKAIESYNEAIRLNPEHADAYSRRGNSYYRLTEYTRAIEDFDEALRLDPGNKTATLWRKSAVTLTSTQAQGYLASAYSYAYEGNYPKAIDYFTRAIKLYPRADTYLSRGLAYLAQNQIEDAIQDYDESIHLNDEAIRLNPHDAKYYGLQNAEAYFWRGLSYSELGQHERAI